MESASRYEIVDTIAAGDFATVYRGRDRDLAREVAIKQIHAQFLADPRQLARYWQEAQLLASLQHPNVLTIYDIVRPRGWLILELMRGSVRQASQGGPLDLDSVRAMLLGCLNALQFLHGNGVVHGDVKPSNILINAQGRVKLGDFGLARRASNEEGSLLKGTTKYMAPEVLSPQFGAVGPASDLYSLGFSAYELMCGAQFESLLPSLSTFGRDKQLAWMMWHAAPDLRLPEVQRILEGVPDDLARVIQRLTAKDQSQRYQSAQDVLYDLRGGAQGGVRAVDPIQEAEQEVAAMAARRKKRNRILGGVAVALSLALCTYMLWPEKKEKKAPPTPRMPQGVVSAVYPDELKLAIVEDGNAREESLKVYDRVVVNERTALLRDLQPQDEVRFEKARDETGRLITVVHATRPERSEGRVKSVSPERAAIVLAVGEGSEQKDLEVAVPQGLKIPLNSAPGNEPQYVKLDELQPGDRAVLHHKAQETGRAATSLTIERLVRTEGVLTDAFDPQTKLLSITVNQGGKTRVVKLRFAERYEIAVNGAPKGKPGDLAKDDRVTVEHDSRIVRVDARRELQHSGTVQHVDLDAKTLTLSGQETKYAVAPPCTITLGGEAAALEDLRAGDSVRIEHRTVDAAGIGVIGATSVAATRPADPTRWAILVAGQDYDDKTLSPLASPLADAKLLADALVKRYKVPPDQVQMFADESLVRLEQAIPEQLKKTGPDARVLVYVTGHAYVQKDKDDKNKVYIAPKDFRLRQPSVTGLPLQWLVDQLEQCPAREKVLLLDTCHSGPGAGLAGEPSTAEMLRTLKPQPNGALLRTVTAVASCMAGQRGQTAPGATNGLFAQCLAHAYLGRADTNRDGQLEPTELFTYLQRAVSESSKAAQVPELFNPNDAPPRLTEAAKKSIHRLAAFLGQTKIDVDSVVREYETAVRLAPKQPEPRLIACLVLIKAREWDAAINHFEKLKLEHKRLLLPVQGLAWLRFEKRQYGPALKDLTELVRRLPPAKKPSQELPLDVQRVFYWAGQLRDFAAEAVPANERPSEEVLADLDAAIAAHGAQAEKRYEQGRQRTQKKVAEFDQLAAQTRDEATLSKIKVERRQLSKYVEFPFDKLAEPVLAGMDEQRTEALP
jgi:serine/threonine-protein kinase